MGETKQINIKNRTYYFSNDQIDLKDFNARLLKVDKKDYNDIDIYYIGYVTIKEIGDYNNISSVNPLYLMINEMIGHFKEKNEIKYLVLDEIRFESNDDLPVNKPIKLPLLKIIIRSIFSENGKFYPQLFLDEALYELV